MRTEGLYLEKPVAAATSNERGPSCPVHADTSRAPGATLIRTTPLTR